MKNHKINCTLRKLFKEEKMRNKGYISSRVCCNGFANANKQVKQHISQHLEFIYQTKILMTYPHDWKLQNLEIFRIEQKQTVTLPRRTKKRVIVLLSQQFCFNRYDKSSAISDINFTFFGRSTLT